MSNIGWIGTGVMGGPMAAHLIRAGYRLTIFTRTESKAKELIDAGARWVGSPQEAAKNQPRLTLKRISFDLSQKYAKI